MIVKFVTLKVFIFLLLVSQFWKKIILQTYIQKFEKFEISPANQF